MLISQGSWFAVRFVIINGRVTRTVVVRIEVERTLVDGAVVPVEVVVEVLVEVVEVDVPVEVVDVEVEVVDVEVEVLAWMLNAAV